MAKQDNPSLLLYGIQDFLPGNENKITSCFPVLRNEESDFLIIRDADWNLKSKSGFSKLNADSAWHIDKNTTKLDLETDIYVEPSQMIILLGPQYLNEFNNFYSEKDGAFLGKTHHIQRGFRISLKDIVSYKGMLSKISKDSINSFDNEIALSKGKSISEKAESALELLTWNYLRSTEDYYLRRLVGYKIKGEGAKYNEFLALASLDLEISEEDVKKLSEDYLSSKIN